MSEDAKAEEGRVEIWPIEKLVPFENNTKLHTPQKIKKLAASIRKSGLSNPPQVDKDGVIITGHARRLAVMELGWPLIKVRVRDDLDEVGVRRLRIDDNETSKGDDITENLVEELAFLTESGEDMSTTWDERDLQFALDDLGDINFDALTDDISDEVNQLSRDTQEKIEEENQETPKVPVFKPLGFPKVTKEQERWLRSMRMFMEVETGKEGADAMMTYAKEHMGLSVENEDE